jgi:hypothetical protein
MIDEDGGPILGFWDGPGPAELVEYFEYVRISGPHGDAVTWQVYLKERMWLLLADWGYPWRE